MQPQRRLLQALTFASSVFKVHGQNSGGKIAGDTWWGVRGARPVDGACAIGSRQTSRRNWCLQAVPDRWCWHQKMASWKEIMLTLLFSGGFSALWGALRLMWCVSCATGAFISPRPCRGKGTGMAVPTSPIYLPLQCPYLSFSCKGERVGGCPLLAARGAPCSSTCRQHPREALGNQVVSLVWTLSHASNCEAEPATSPQTLEIIAVIALVTRVDMKIWR